MALDGINTIQPGDLYQDPSEGIWVVESVNSLPTATLVRIHPVDSYKQPLSGAIGCLLFKDMTRLVPRVESPAGAL